ncbi:PHA/PHB synthase family protein [Pseudooceanicola sp. 502str34]|uniref:PHA/PHB synthase family protein n=1 Tax=Maritimibacter alkaliphilus TaxID=404236 RepID=UPI001C94113E|nr:class I poly(R)-hydroxyalkanoic acid synthase [Maritimibacter alkaliphilus]MBY6091920.1 class I poly(R)-hydroxyalkanoic acid synthase [Maritimibacter alkaliphilus]
MATDHSSEGKGDVPSDTVERIDENLAKVEALTQRLFTAVANRDQPNPGLNAPDTALFADAANAYWAQSMENPARIFEHQLEFWGQSVKHFLEAQQTLAKGKFEAPPDSTPEDRRFSNPLWKTHPYFNFIKQQYMLNAQAISRAVEDAEDLDPIEKRRLQYFARQIIDMMAPTNFLATNPDALERAIETEGESLVKGYENLVSDIEANKGQFVVKLADDKAFKMGENIASTKGEVVYRNRMMELIQYTPTTEQVHAIPLVIFPPWINKFYILDLKAQNSLIKYITDQGFTLFVVSWINPDESYRDVGMEEYIEEGFLTAINEAKAITGQKQVNVVGYCIAGTTTSLMLSLMKKRGDKSVKSATFFTTLTDFSEQGEFTPFLQNDFVDAIEAEVREKGILRSHIMSRTFSFLRSNDLIYGPAIRSYMLGEAPPAFDLLHWNGDGTNLPAKMAIQYLRQLCQGNEFTTTGIELFGETLHISDISVPTFSVTCERDHIAAWKDSYRGYRMTKSRDRTFIVSESGHVAGIVNPPSKKKYGHYTNDDLSQEADGWLAGATYNEGSWWPRWSEWLAKKSGKMVAAREPGDENHPPIGPAPGKYVTLTAAG